MGQLKQTFIVHLRDFTTMPSIYVKYYGVYYGYTIFKFLLSHHKSSLENICFITV